MALSNLRRDIVGDNGARENAKQVDTVCWLDKKGSLPSTRKLRTLVARIRTGAKPGEKKTK